MTRRYAAGTEVSPEKSRAEIESILSRYGADQFMYGWQDGAAVVAFRARGRHVRFLLPLPSPTDPQFEWRKRGGGSVRRTPQQRADACQQEVRARWRALALAIKAKLECVASGIAEFEDEFLAQIVLPNGQTMAEHSRPLIARAYETGRMPPLLPFLGPEDADVQG